MSGNHEIKAEDTDIRLDRWFKRHMPQLPHALLEKSLRKGVIRLDGKKAKTSDRVQQGQTISWSEHFVIPDAQPRARGRYQATEEDRKEIEKRILYQDEHMLIIDKPAGLAVQGGSKQDKNLDDMLAALVKDPKNKPKLVHRLDKDTSGVLILARNAKAATVLTKAFAEKRVQKFYWALIRGCPSLHEGTIDLPLAKIEKGRVSRSGAVDPYEEVGVESQGKRAITHYRVCDHLSDKLAWVEAEPVTGRMHQLRVHFTSVGHPIIGDGKYGGSEAFVEGMTISKNLHLHARRIVLPALFGKAVDVSAPLPRHMRDSWKQLGFES